MNLKSLSDAALEKNLLELVEKERALLCSIILHVMEIYRRKKFLEAHPNLFSYLQSFLKFSHGTAQRRMDAAMLAVEAPEILSSIKSADLNLAQITAAQKAFRKFARVNKTKLHKERKLQILKMIEAKTVQESEVILYSELGIQPSAKTKTTRQADGSVRIETTFTKAQWELLESAKQLLSHSVPTGQFAELVTYMSERVVAHKTKASRNSKRILETTPLVAERNEANAMNSSNIAIAASESNPLRNELGKFKEVASEPGQIPCGIQKTKTSKTSTSTTTSTTSTTSKSFVQNYSVKPARKAIPATVRRAILTRTQHCEYKDRNTGQTCNSRWQLQIDHIQPIWAGGNDSPENLQVLCASHNRARYQRQSGIRAR